MAVKKIHIVYTLLLRKSLCLLLLLPATLIFAQTPFSFNIKNGNMQIAISKKISAEEIDKYVYKYKLQSLLLQKLVKENFTDSVKAQGWKIEVNNDTLVQLTKGFMAADVLTPISNKQFFSPMIVNGGLMNNTFFVNRFKYKNAFTENKNTVTFTLPGFQKAKKVLLAASFTNWKENALPMQQVDKTWQVTIELKEGKHAYKYLVDDQWIVDPNNYINESDDEGNTNSIICKSNTSFSLQGFKNARKVFVAGSFNNWEENNLFLQKTNDGWELPIYLQVCCRRKLDGRSC
jgi:hypothetical protein